MFKINLSPDPFQSHNLSLRFTPQSLTLRLIYTDSRLDPNDYRSWRVLVSARRSVGLHVNKTAWSDYNLRCPSFRFIQSQTEFPSRGIRPSLISVGIWNFESPTFLYAYLEAHSDTSYLITDIYLRVKPPRTFILPLSFYNDSNPTNLDWNISHSFEDPFINRHKTPFPPFTNWLFVQNLCKLLNEMKNNVNPDKGRAFIRLKDT